MVILTKEMLINGTGCTPGNADKFLPYFLEVLPKFKIDTRLRLAAFLAQTAHESNLFSTVQENLNYSAEGLANTWPKRYAQKLQNGLYAKSPAGRYLPSDKAKQIARKSVLIANDCYANRMGNGDVASGDGWRYSGKGLKQITGKSNYQALSKYTGLDFVSKPELLLEPGYAVISACWFWQANNLSAFADLKDIKGMTKVINGGEIGLQKRIELYEKCLAAIPE
jgi:putative chitinase